MRRDDSYNDQIEALNRYLDDLASQGTASASRLDPTLAGTVTQIHGLARRPLHSSAFGERVWRERVAPSLSRPTAIAPQQRRRVVAQLAAAILLLMTIGAGYLTYRAMPDPDNRSVIPAAASPIGTATAALPGCTAQPRAPGSVVALAGQPPTLPRVLPRYNDDPVHFDQRSEQVDGTLLIFKRQPAPAKTVADIQDTVAELTACRFYAVGADRRIDLDGRYFALYSDDYFRGELAGYREAGKTPKLTVFWEPDTVPAIADARLLDDGRVVVVFSTDNDRHHPNWRWVAIFVQHGDRWLVDEVGEATFPVEGTPTAQASATATPISLDIALYDEVATQAAATPTPAFVPTHQSNVQANVNLRAGPTTASKVVTVLPPASPLLSLSEKQTDAQGETWMKVKTTTGKVGWIRTVDVGPPTSDHPQRTVCSPLSSTPVPCGGAFQRFGPYLYNEFPAGTDVTIRLHNVGAHEHRFVVEGLSIDVTIKSGGEADFVMNASPGKYLFLIYEGGSEPIGAGVFEFIAPNQQRSNG